MASIIKFEHVTYKYPLTEEPAVVDINLELEEGKLYGIIGPNGAGKSTLSVMMCGFIPSFFKGELEGNITVKGKNVLDYAPGELSKIAGYVFQNPFTQISGVKETVFEEIAFALENLGYPVEEMEERVLAIAEKTGIQDLLLNNPYELSGGQQQRVALASVLVHQPEIMVIDEPTSQLDPEGTEKVFEVIAEMKRAGSTIVLVEHKIDLLAEFADEIIVVKDGRIIKNGPTGGALTDIALIDQEIKLPHVTELSKQMLDRGVTMEKIPVSEAEAVEVFARLLKGGDQ